MKKMIKLGLILMLFYLFQIAFLFSVDKIFERKIELNNITITLKNEDEKIEYIPFFGFWGLILDVSHHFKGAKSIIIERDDKIIYKTFAQDTYIIDWNSLELVKENNMMYIFYYDSLGKELLVSIPDDEGGDRRVVFKSFDF